MGARRDRHGRGLRGPLLPSSLPAALRRSERFDDLVLDAFDPLLARWRTQLRTVDVAVQDVPPPGVVHDPAADPVPLARNDPARGSAPARIVVYRRPVELRASTRAERTDLLADVLAEQVAELLGLTPDQVDPGYRGDADED